MDQAKPTINSHIAKLQLQPRSKIRSLEPVIRDLLTEPALLRQAVRKADWTLVDALGRRCIGQGYAALRYFQAIEISSKKHGQARQTIEQTMAKFIAGEVDRDVSAIGASRRGFSGVLGDALDLPIVCFTRGLLGILFAHFNATYQEQHTLLAKHPNDVIDAYKPILEAMQTLLRRGQMRVYSMLLQAQDTLTISHQCMALAGEIEQQAASFARSQAVLVNIMTHLRTQGQGGNSEKIGRLAVRAGALTRELVASQAAYYQLALKLLSESPDKLITNLSQAAADTAFETDIPNGRNVEISKLNKVADGDFIEVEGFVQRVTASQGPAGLLSHIELLDPSSKATTEVAAFFMHLPHLGITDGAFCRLSGLFREQSKSLENRPGIEVDKLSLAELSRSSWRIKFLQSADRWYQAWRNGINMYWSLGPHEVSDAPDTASLEGAGELIYPHFMQD